MPSGANGLQDRSSSYRRFKLSETSLKDKAAIQNSSCERLNTTSSFPEFKTVGRTSSASAQEKTKFEHQEKPPVVNEKPFPNVQEPAGPLKKVEDNTLAAKEAENTPDVNALSKAAVEEKILESSPRPQETEPTDMMEQIKAIKLEVEDLRRMILNSGKERLGEDSKKIEEMLIQKTIKLDNINVNKEEKAREARKEAIVYVQDSMKIMDSKLSPPKKETLNGIQK